MTPNSTGFVVCLRNEGAEDIELRKVYSVVPDEDATSKGFLRDRPPAAAAHGPIR